jgi:chromate transport protein ChrA
MGVQCFFIYSCLPWIILTFMGLLSSLVIEGDASNLSHTAKLIFMGCNAAAAGIMARSFINYFISFMDKRAHMLLIACSAALFFYHPSVLSIGVSLAGSALIGLYL